MYTRFKRKFHALINDNQFRVILHGGSYSMLAKVGIKLLGIVTSIISARYYGPTVLGLLAIITSITMMASMFSGFGMQTSILKLAPEYMAKHTTEAWSHVYRRIFSMVLIFSCAMAVLVFCMADALGRSVFHDDALIPLIRLCAVAVVFSSIVGINMPMVRALGKVKLSAVFEFLPKVISFVLLLVLTFMFFHLYNVIYIFLISTILISFITTFYLFNLSKNGKKTLSSVNPPEYKSILALSFPMFVMGGLQLIVAQTDITMIGIFRTSKEVGIYSVVFALSSMTTFMLKSINGYTAPKFSELYSSGNTGELVRIGRKSSKLIFFTTFPILMMLLIFGRLILTLYGDDFTVGYIALVFLLVGQFINSSTGSVGYLLVMTGSQKIYTNIVLISALMNIILNYLLIPRYGIFGAAFASMFSISMNNIVAAIYVKKKLGFNTVYMPML